MVAVEAQSFGKPVIAYGRGGSLETIRGFDFGQHLSDVPTGIFFPIQSIESLSAAILEFESKAHDFDAQQIIEHAQQFSVAVFQSRVRKFVQSALLEFRSRGSVGMLSPVAMEHLDMSHQ